MGTVPDNHIEAIKQIIEQMPPGQTFSVVKIRNMWHEMLGQEQNEGGTGATVVAMDFLITGGKSTHPNPLRSSCHNLAILYRGPSGGIRGVTRKGGM